MVLGDILEHIIPHLSRNDHVCHQISEILSGVKSRLFDQTYVNWKKYIWKYGTLGQIYADFSEKQMPT